MEIASSLFESHLFLVFPKQFQGSGTKNKCGDILSDFQFLLSSYRLSLTSVNELGDADAHAHSVSKMWWRIRVIKGIMENIKKKSS